MLHCGIRGFFLPRKNTAVIAEARRRETFALETNFYEVVFDENINGKKDRFAVCRL